MHLLQEYDSSRRFAAMQGNDMMNVNARHEALFNAQLDNAMFTNNAYNDLIIFITCKIQ